MAKKTSKKKATKASRTPRQERPTDAAASSRSAPRSTPPKEVKTVSVRWPCPDCKKATTMHVPKAEVTKAKKAGKKETPLRVRCDFCNNFSTIKLSAYAK